MAGCFGELAEALRTGVDEDGLAEIAGRHSTEVLIVQLAVIGSVLDPDTARRLVESDASVQALEDALAS